MLQLLREELHLALALTGTALQFIQTFILNIIEKLFLHGKADICLLLHNYQMLGHVTFDI